MNQTGLRLDQAPPLLVPLRFFLTAPLFPVLAAAYLAWHGPEALATRWSPALLVLTHLLTLGFLAQVMVGAMMQLLPVLAGAPIARPGLVGRAVHIPLTLGALVLWAGLTVHAGLLPIAVLLLGGGFAVFIFAAAHSLLRAGSGHPTIPAMRLALTALALTVALGLGLGLAHGGLIGWPLQNALTDMHLAWGLLGWVGLLVMGVAYQVVPMFQLTPQYPPWMQRWLAPAVFAALILWSLSRALAPQAAGLTFFLGATLAFGLAAFALMTLRLQSRRKRRLPDVTANFWRLGMGCLLLAVALWLLTQRVAIPRREWLLGMLFIVGFAASVIQGMLYKIVPFLLWLHLRARSIRGALPNMKEILPDRRTMPQFWIHAAAVVLLAATALAPRWFLYPAAGITALSFAWLGWNLLSAYRVFRRVVRAASADGVLRTED